MRSFTALPRRTFLKGAGVAMGLPFLEAMTPRRAIAETGAPAPVRMAYIFFPNGVILPDWNPVGEGRDFRLPKSLAALEGMREQILFLSGLAQDNARAKGDGPGDHARSAAAFLTGSHPFKTAGADIRNGISVDQLAAEHVGHLTRLPSLEIGIEGGRNAGQCDSGYSCAYSNNISWKSATTPMAKEIQPKLVFERLFGGGKGDIEARRKRDALRLSILDLVAQDAQKLQSQLGKTDRRKLDEYFTSVRELEQRLERTRDQDAKIPVPDIDLPPGVPKDQDEHMTQMYDLLALAFQTDTTRVASFMLANEGSNRSYPQVGVNDGWHHLSHHQDKADWISQLQKIDEYLVGHFARFLKKLDSIKEGESTLLKNSMIVYGSAIADGNRHSHHDLPILLAGGGGGTLQGGRHLKYGENTPLNNLYLSLLERIGAPTTAFGDSTGLLTNLNG